MGFGSKLKKAFGRKKEDEKDTQNQEINVKIKEIDVNVSTKSNQNISDNVPVQNHKDFKYLNDLIQSGAKKIVLDSDIVSSGNESFDYPKGIEIRMDDFVFDGNGHTIDAKGKTRIFQCFGKNIVIKNVILKNGHHNWGGAVENNGDLTILDSTFLQNETNEYGGAIRNNAHLEVIKSIFIQNNANDDGGAIFNDEGATLTITESKFNQNKANKDGGAVKNNGDLTITESTFTQNLATRAGAIKNEANLSIKESALTKNTAKFGGAIQNFKGNFKIFNCRILDNRSENSIILNNDSLQIYNTNFIDNQSKNLISNENVEANLGVIGGEFKKNEIEEAIICNNGKSCTIDKTIFKNPNSKNIINQSDLTLINPKFEDEGKIIFNEGYLLIKKSYHDILSKIQGNGIVESDLPPDDEKYDFGHLYKLIQESSSKEIVLNNDFILQNYERDYFEGGIELDIDDLVIDGAGHVIDGNERSRIFIITGNNITLKNITFKRGHSFKSYENMENNHGGLLKINHNANIKIECCKFINANSEGHGGAIYNNANLNITKSTFSENATLFGCGGAIYNCGGKLRIIESTFIQNTANEDGGAIKNNADLEILQSAFNENIASVGGAIQNHGKLTITNSKLNKNTAKGKEYGDGGGAIQNYGDLSITDSLLCENRVLAEDYGIGGGAVRNDGILAINKSQLSKNASNYGGAIFNKNNCKITIIESIFNENMAKDVSAGAIYNLGEATINDSVFNDNTGRWSGAIYNNDGGELRISASLFKNNIAKWGGAIINEKSDLTITESIFNNNIAELYGGAIHYNGGNLIITDSTLTQNSAENGGAIFANEEGEMTVTQSMFNKNMAELHGGAVYSKNFGIKLNSCTFEDNQPENVYGKTYNGDNLDEVSYDVKINK